MFKKKTLLSVALAALSIGALASCGGTPKQSGTLYVCVYDGGYGTEWIDTIAKNYEQETGIHIEWKADPNILERIENQLTKRPEYDIYMSHDINWRDYASAGLLENLDDLYESDVKVGSSTKKFSERLIADALPISKLDTSEGNHYYKVCYTQGVGGFIYNVDMFRENGWEVPTTYNELAVLCDKIVKAKIEVGDRNYVVPFAWSGQDRQYYWDYPVYEWWAELAGLDKLNTVKKYLGPTGKYSDGYEMYNPETYNKEFVQAYEYWYNLIAKNKSYGQSGAQGDLLANAQSLFITGQAAMIPYAHWGKYELKQANDGKELNFNVAMMRTPKVTSTTDSYNYNVGFGDTMLIPARAAEESKQLAKDFLRYLATPEACRTFVEKSDGAFLAFDYSDVQLGELVNDTFIKSVYEKITESKNFNIVTDNPIAYAVSNSLMPWVNNYYCYNSAMSETDKYTPTYVGSELYRIAKEKWSGWMSTAHIHD